MSEVSGNLREFGLKLGGIMRLTKNIESHGAFSKEQSERMGYFLDRFQEQVDEYAKDIGYGNIPSHYTVMARELNHNVCLANRAAIKAPALEDQTE
jgi:hypothetical protein